jgi:GNAT superfamily N-acetyltransferase
MWRLLTAADLPQVLALADHIHPDHPERPEVFSNRLALFGPGCLFAEADGRPLGYCLSHPGRVGQAPPLDTVLASLPDTPDCLYLHDLALLPEARGRHLGAAAVARLVAVALREGFSRIALTAVGNSPRFWERQGFVAWAAGPASYGAALYMVRELRIDDL